MQKYLTLIWILWVISGCQGQSQTAKDDLIVGGLCQGCEAIFEYGDREITSEDTLPGYLNGAPKLKVTGRVFDLDGGHPVPGVLIYVYHTDRQGIYSADDDAQGWGRRHGRLRGWARSDAQGRYTFYTIRPASYPNREEPEHIHMTVKEDGMTPYYISDIVFDDDPLMTEERRSNLSQRGGSGLTKVKNQGDWGLVSRDIYLGQNITGYPN